MFSVPLDVVVKCALLCERGPASVAEIILVALQEESSLIAPQAPSIRAHSLTGDLFVRGDANVLGEFPMMMDDSVTLQALVASAVPILVLKNTK